MTDEFKAWVERHDILQTPYLHTWDRPDTYRYDGFMGTVGKGWVPILDRLARRLIALGWDRRVAQIKEKFGGLRFYSDSLTSEMHEAVREAEAESFRTCEDCGAPGEHRGGGWIRTLCDACEAAR